MHTTASQVPDSRKLITRFLHRPPVFGLSYHPKQAVCCPSYHPKQAVCCPSYHPKQAVCCSLSFVALALAVLPAAWPYFGAGLPRTNDALTHLYRALALERLVRDGHLWPRWSPDLVHGYGYPVFNFFPMLSHYLILLFHIVGLPLTSAYRIAVLTHCILAAWFAYLLARDLFGPAGGWVAALAYTYSPYLLYDAHVRGSLPESQALALLPLLFLTLRRAAVRGGRWVAATALAFAATFVSHHGITFQALIPIGILLVWLAWREGWRNLWKPLTGLALGVLTIAFFWLPALAEVQYIRSDVSISQGYSYAENFLTVRDLLAWPRLPADPALLNPPVVRSLPQVALAAAALVLPWRWRSLTKATRQQIGLWLCLFVICTALVTPLSRPVWDVAPLLKLTFFPWRILGVASLAGAMLAAGALTGLATRPRTPTLRMNRPPPDCPPDCLPDCLQSASASASASATSASRGLAKLVCLTLLLLVSSIPWLYPPREPVSEEPTIADLMAFENPPLFIGTTTLGEFLPRWVEKLPDTTDLRNELASGGSPDRMVAPEGVTIHGMEGSPLNATYQIQAEQPATLTYRQFYFPGWRATLDGEPISCYPSHPEGLLLLDVPAGTHTLRLTFGSTLPRTLGWVISGLSTLALITILAGVDIPVWLTRGEDAHGSASSHTIRNRQSAALHTIRNRQSAALHTIRNRQSAALHTIRNRQSAALPIAANALPCCWLLLLVGVVFAVKLFFDTVDTPLHRSTLGPEGLYGIQHAQSVDFAGELLLLGYEQSAERIPSYHPKQAVCCPADSEVTLTLYWRPLHPIGVNYDVAVRLVDDSGQVWSAGDAVRPPNWRFAPGTDRWPLDGYVMDPSVLKLLDGTPPGEYTFHVGLVRHDTDQTVAEHQVGRLVVTHPAHGDRPLEEGMTPAPETYAWGGLRLLGSRTDRREAAPGDPARVTLLWQVTDPDAIETGDPTRMDADEVMLTLRLATADDQEILATRAPVARHYPPASWQPGDRLRTQITLRLPARTPAGEQSWQVRVDGVGQTTFRPIAPLHIRIPERRWTSPPLNVQTDVLLGGVATLLGADVQPPAIIRPPATVTVTLAWQAEVETTRSYRVFLHLIDSSEGLVTQSDGEPANWTRPTTGWLPGEVVMDERTLHIPADTPPGEYALRCGLYNLATGERLTTADGSDAIPLTTLVVAPSEENE